MLRVEVECSIDVGEVLRSTRRNSVANCRVVGRDDWNGRIILFWLETVERDGHVGDPISFPACDSTRIAHVGVLDINSKEIKVIFFSSNYLDIVQCTVDKEVEHLAFVNRTLPPPRSSEKEIGSDGLCNGGETKCASYMCYWTSLSVERETVEARDIRPLNKDSCDYIKVQFLSASQLLMFIAKEAIYLYTLPPDQEFLGNVTPPPVLYERLAGHFLWAQWDVVSGHLFHLLFRPKPGVSLTRWAHTYTDRNGRVSDDPSDGALKFRPVLVGLQFHSGSAAETVLNTPLELLTAVSPEADLPSADHPARQRAEDRHSPLTNQIQDGCFDQEMSVIAKPNGTVFICQGLSEDTDDGRPNTDREMSVKYSVTAVHHACTLVCHIRGKSDAVTGGQHRIHFFPNRDSLVVALPGVFTHLLDLGLTHEPANHILFPACSLPPEDGDCSEFYSWGATPPDVQRSPCSSFSSSSSSSCLISYGSERVRSYSVDVTSDSLLDAFRQFQHRNSSFSSVRQCILHHLLVHLQDFSAVETVLSELVKDPTDPQLVKLFQEFLIGGSFAHTYNSAETKFVSLLPASLSDSMQPLQESIPDGRLRVVIGYSPLKDASSVLLAPTERHLPHRRPTDLWCRLWSLLNATTSSPATPCRLRFSPRSMRDRLLALGSPRVPTNPTSVSSPFVFPSDDAGASEWKPGSFPDSPSTDAAASFCRRFLGAATGFKRALSGGGASGKSRENGESLLPASLEAADDEDCSQLEQISYWNLKEISVHLSKNLPGEKPTEINDVACCYVANQLRHSQMLCHYLFCSFEVMPLLQGSDFHPYSFLNGLNLGNATLLFSLLERYLVATKEVVFPLPQGFDAFFSVLAYKCLDIRTFLQYVDFGVTRLSSEVLHCIAVDLSSKDVRDKIGDGLRKDDVVLEIAWRLPRWKTAYFLEHLQHPTNTLLQVHNIVSKRLEKHLRYAGSKRSDGRYHQEADSRRGFGGRAGKTWAPANTGNGENVAANFGVEEEEEEVVGQVPYDAYNEAFPSLPPNLSYSISVAMDSFMRWLQDGGDCSLTRNTSFSSVGFLSLSPSSSKLHALPTSTSASSFATGRTNDPDDAERLSLVRERQMNNLIDLCRTRESFRDGIRPPPHFWR